MKKVVFIVFVLFLNVIFLQTFAQNAIPASKYSHKSAKLTSELISYIKKRFIIFKIDGTVVEAYDRYKHSSGGFFSNRKYQNKAQELIDKKGWKSYTYHTYGKYFIGSNINIKNDNHKQETKNVEVYDLDTFKRVFKLNNVRYLEVECYKDFYFFLAHMNNKENWIIDKNGKILVKAKLVTVISKSTLDGYTILGTSYYGYEPKFKFDTLKELVNTIKTIEKHKLNSNIAINNYFVKNADKNYKLFNISRTYNSKTGKYYINTKSSKKSKEYDDIREFYHYYLVKENGLWGVASQNGDEIIKPNYQAILINNENDIELCNNKICSAYKLDVAKKPLKILKDPFERTYGQKLLAPLNKPMQYFWLCQGVKNSKDIQKGRLPLKDVINLNFCKLYVAIGENLGVVLVLLFYVLFGCAKCKKNTDEILEHEVDKREELNSVNKNGL